MLKDRYEVAGSLLQKLWNVRRLISSPVSEFDYIPIFSSTVILVNSCMYV